MDAYIIISGIIAIIAALVSFALSIVEQKDKRRKFGGFSARSIKQYAAFISLALTLVTVILEANHKMHEKLESIEKEHLKDSVQRANIDTTLHIMNQTLITQKTSLDSTDTILNRQRVELLYQADMLYQEKIAIDNYSKILRQQGLLSDSINSSIELLHSNLVSQQQSLGIMRQTVKDLQPLNFPLSNSLGLMFKLRVYVKGETQLWKTSIKFNNDTIPVNSEIKTFVQNHIGTIPSDKLASYWKFFYTFGNWGIDHSYLIDYKFNTKKGRLTFQDFTVFSGASSFVFQNNIYYNGDEHYFEGAYDIPCGFVASNIDGISNFGTLVDSSYLFLKLRYSGNKSTLLSTDRNEQKSIEIDHLVVSSVLGIKYGNSLQYTMIPEKSETFIIRDTKVIKEFWNEDVNEGDLWRYCIVKVPIGKSR